jgi:3-oxoadipate enol-lactonase
MPSEPTATPVAIHHEVSGPADAPAILLGESLGTTLAMWDGQAPLAERLRTVRYDHRGHGRSPMPPGPYEIADLGRDVLALMDRLGLDRASHCGVSLGGMVGMWLAANAPERVERLILICTSAHMPPASAWAERAATVRRTGGTETIADAVVERWLTPGYAAERPDVRATLRDMLAGASPEGYAACCDAIRDMDLRPLLGRIEAPTLVISGAEDQAAPPEHQRLIADAIPGARHEVLSPAAHIAPVEQPEAVTTLIVEHLGGP